MAIQSVPHYQNNFAPHHDRKPRETERSRQVPPYRVLKAAQCCKVLDIGGSNLPSLLNDLIQRQLVTPSDGSRHLPALFFSDDRGLNLWSSITHLPNYYQTRDEIDLLRSSGDEIIDEIISGTPNSKNGLCVIDLGAGNVRKVVPLLQKLDLVGIPIAYYALDLSKSSLVTAMASLDALDFKNIVCYGLWGAFDHAIEHFARFPAEVPRVFMSLGSMFGNDYPDSAISLLSKWQQQMRAHDRMLIGMDGTTDKKDIWDSYHDREGLFEKFIINGFNNSNSIIGQKWFCDSQWEVSGKIVTNPHLMHHFVLTAKEDICVVNNQSGVQEFVFAKGQNIECYRAFKLGVEEMTIRFTRAGLRECCRGWQSATGRINQYLLRPCDRD